MNKTDILIIGGGPAGVMAAVTAKKTYPSKRVTLVRKEQKSIIPCGIPYIFHRLNSVDENVMPDKPLIDNNIDLVIGEVSKINAENKEVILGDKSSYGYDKLILACGSKPQLVPIPGVEKEGVWLVKKDYEYLKQFREAALKSKKVIIIGGGFIGIEFAEELSRIKNLEINIVEMADHCLITNFDTEFVLAAEEKLKSNGVKIHLNKKVKKWVEMTK